ncbi:hypothetical protein V1507DRAFT_402272 [Lipomyces tetrasporus]
MSSPSSSDDDLDKTISEWIRNADAGSGQKEIIKNDPVLEDRIKNKSFFSQFQKPSAEESVEPEIFENPSDVFPREMSCTQQFDELVKCYSIGGQVRNVYRYGSIRDCNDRWAMFKFCIGTRLDSEEDKRKKIYEFYKRKMVEDLKSGSSENVWKARTQRRKPLFSNDEDEGVVAL